MFLTWDKNLLAVGKALAAHLSIQVMKPEDFLENLQIDCDTLAESDG